MKQKPFCAYFTLKWIYLIFFFNKFLGFKINIIFI
jgi:hypothetical protein